MHQSRFRALGSAHLRWCAIVHLVHGRGIRRVCVGVGVHITGCTMLRRRYLSRRLPPDAAHMGASSDAAPRSRLMRLNARLQGGWRSISRWVRRRAHTISVSARGSRGWAANSEVRWQGSTLLQVLEVRSVTVHVGGQVHCGRHGHGSLARRGCRQGGTVARQMIAVRSSLLDTLRGCQCCCGSRGGFFNGTAVVILMAGQGRLACKRLLAVGIRAFVRTVARMCTTVAGEGAAVAKFLQKVNQHCTRIVAVGSLHTFAHVSQV